MSFSASPLRDTLRDLCRRMDLAEVYEVGGCLRDELLGRAPEDIDLAVCGIEAEDLERRARAQGHASKLVVAERLIGVRLRAPGTPAEGIELALARTEVSTGPGHTDFAITADPSVTIEEDLGRRDFTVNAIARHLFDERWVDPHDGRGDVERRLLRTVSETAFRDDPLRILRGLARVARDGLDVEAQTHRQMQRHAGAFAPADPGDVDTWSLSAERVYAELEKVLSGAGAARALGLADALGILAGTLPDRRGGAHALDTLAAAVARDATLDVRWAALLHDHEPGAGRRARLLLHRLRAPRVRIDRVTALVAGHEPPPESGAATLDAAARAEHARRFLARVGRDRTADQLTLRACEAPESADLAALTAAVAGQRDAPVTVRELAVDGHDLMALGLTGRRIGEAQSALLDAVLADPSRNTRDELLRRARP